MSQTRSHSFPEAQGESKKARVDENERWSEDCDDLFNLKTFLGSGLSLFSTEALLEDDSSSTNDALANNVPEGVICSVEKKQEHEEENDEVEYVAFDSLPCAGFEPEVQRVIQEHGTIPPGDGRRTIVLDLDETLVHSSVVPIQGADYEFSVDVGDASFTVYARKRPHCDHFLRELKRMGFDIVVFTASKQTYADKVLGLLDPQGEYVKPTHRLFREHCICFHGNYLKDLRVLNRDLARTVIVDNSPSAFALQQENGIPIDSWFDDQSDTELLKLLDLVQVLSRAEDARVILRKQFNL
jgi:CTD small phosphatase-like protein 2